MNVSRRRLVQVLTAVAAGAPAEAQAPPGAVSATPDAELEGARQYSRVAVSLVRRVPLDMATEPAMKFTPRS
jgi:hypothetical protein